jgi:16S rRNA (guanine1516-N2)-methyltransferase
LSPKFNVAPYADTAEAKREVEKIKASIGDLYGGESPWTLLCDGEVISLKTPFSPKPFSLDLLTGKEAHRLKTSGQSLPLIKALGKSKTPLRVWDATAGWCRDALVLAGRGHTVTAMERSPIIYLLTQNALQRGHKEPHFKERFDSLSLKNSDFLKVPECTLSMESPDVIYLDPMYPDLGRSALSPLEMQILQALSSEPQREEALLLTAQSLAKNRVIVKRPLKAPPILPPPSFSISSKMVRFDIYNPTH